MKTISCRLAFLTVVAIASAAPLEVDAIAWTTTSYGAETEVNGARLELQFFSPKTVRVVRTPLDAPEPAASLSVTATADSTVNVAIKTAGKTTTLTTSALVVKANDATGCLAFYTPAGRLLTAETTPAEFVNADFPGAEGFTVSQTFSVAADEHLYGLGSLTEENLSRRNVTRNLFPGNIDDGFPVVQSSKGYGIVWDNYSPTTFEDNASGMTFKSEIADAEDYYFINGGNADGVIAQMRLLSGCVPMFPLWTYGFWQSRERYKTQHEPTAVVKAYRQRGIPLDGIIQDWQYWGNNYLWNAMEFLNPAYDRPKEMIDSIHGLDAHMIISVWSSFGPKTKPYAKLAERGLLFDFATWPESGVEGWPPRMDYPSGVKPYNPYSGEARDIYWDYLSNIHSLGLDGWWMDSTEPDHFDGKMDFPTGMGTFRKVRGAYPLMTVGGVYDHQRDVDTTRRVFILTRSGWFGQQRYGCNVWTGDVVSTWDMLRRQVPQHLNFTMSGNPNTNSDLGGFFSGRYNLPGGVMAHDNPLFRELTVRWTQLGVFTPMMRSHGADSPREIYLFGKEGEPVYDALVSAVRLRYALLPYIYSTAWEVSSESGSFMRPLVMDFPNDKEGLNAADRFMFGRSLLVAPILSAYYTDETATRPDAAADSVDFSAPYTVEVLLPKGTDWFDFFTGKKHAGGKSATIRANISTIPLFARAGAIVPIGPEVNFATEKPWDDLTIKVFPGADGSFVLYEDEGDGYNYEKGVYSTIEMSYDTKNGNFTIGERQGSFPGMLDRRIFNIVNMATGAEQRVAYDGSPVKVKI